jgi:hypothetical protein
MKGLVEHGYTELTHVPRFASSLTASGHTSLIQSKLVNLKPSKIIISQNQNMMPYPLRPRGNWLQNASNVGTSPMPKTLEL